MTRQRRAAQTWRIRDAEPADVGRIAEMVRELATYEKEVDKVESTAESFTEILFPDGPRPDRQLPDRRGRTTPRTVGAPSGSPPGTSRSPPGPASNGIWLEDLYVDPEQRGSGLGKALLARLAQIAVERGYKRLEWWVLDWNEPAIGFYRRLGAESLDEWTHYRIDGDALQTLGAAD